MCGLRVCVRGLQFVNQRPLFRPYERVTVRLGLKAVKASLFLMKLQNRTLHRYMLRLKFDLLVEEFRDKALESGVSVARFDQLLNILREFNPALSNSDRGSSQAEEVGNGF